MGQVSHQAIAYLGLCNMQRLGIFSLPLGWDVSPSQGYLLQFAGTCLYT